MVEGSKKGARTYLMGKTQQWIIFAGRLMIGLAFMGSGLVKIGAWNQVLHAFNNTPLRDSVGVQLVPAVLVAFILAESIGGFMICLGFRTRVAAVMLVAVMAVSIFFLQQFWHMKDAALIRGYFRFLLDVKILGGLFYVFAFGPGRLSVDKG